MPKLGDLAWWKKGDSQMAKTVPPPPAMHFDPEPAMQMATRGKKVAKESVASIDPAEDIKQTLAEALQAGKQPPTHPIRTPYSFESGTQARASTDNSFEAAAGQIKTKLPDWNAPLPSIASAAKKSDGGWRNDFVLPANSISKDLNSSIKAARGTLNRAQSDISTEAGSFADRIQPSIEIADSNSIQSADQAGKTPSVNTPATYTQPLTEQVPQALNSLQNEFQSQVKPAVVQPQKQSPTKAATAIARLNIPKDDQPPFQPPRVAQAPGIPGLPSNSLRNSMPTMQLPATTQPPSHRSYPSTPHSIYAPRSRDSQNKSIDNLPAVSSVGDAQFIQQTDSNESVGVVTTGGIQSAAEGGNLSTAEVLIPATIIQGNGSFAPGSVSNLILPKK